MEPVIAKNIWEAISNVMSRVGYVQKESKGQLKYSYASESSLIAALRPEMVVERIIVFCLDMTNIEVREYQSNQGTQMVNVSLTGRWKFVHAPSGSEIVVTARGEGSDSSDKANNKAMTCSMKYALRQTFLIETGDDPDKEQSDERGTGITAHGTIDISGWKTAYLETLLAQKHFSNIFEVRNALKLSKTLQPGVTPLKGLEFWVGQYKQARVEAKLEPKEAAEHADFLYSEEKAKHVEGTPQ